MMGRYNHSLLIDATVMASQNWTIIGRNTLLPFSRHNRLPQQHYGLLNHSFRVLLLKNGTINFFTIFLRGEKLNYKSVAKEISKPPLFGS